MANTLVDGAGVCKGVVEPSFTPTTFDLEKLYKFAEDSTNPYAKTNSGTKPFGSIVFYSNIDQLVNFYLQGSSDATETVIGNFNTYTDGYAVTVSYNFRQSDLLPGFNVGFCLTSQLAGQSCVAAKPRTGTSAADAAIYSEDFYTYWNSGDKISTKLGVAGMTKQPNPKDDTTKCGLNGFSTWRCQSSVGPNQAMKPSDGYYNIVCSRFMPTYATTMVGSDLKDYRFAPPSVSNAIYTPLSIWAIKDTPGADPTYWIMPLSQFSGASGIVAGVFSAAIAVYTLF